MGTSVPGRITIGTDELHCAHCGTRVDVDREASRAVYEDGLDRYRESFGRGFPSAIRVVAGGCSKCAAEVQRISVGGSTVYTTTHNPQRGR